MSDQEEETGGSPIYSVIPPSRWVTGDCPFLGWARLFLMFNYAVPECPDVTLIPGFPLFFFFNYLISLLSAITIGLS